MNISLSWDLFVLVFFVIIISYSFIIGRDNTLKVILGTYVAALAADATGNLFNKYFSGSEMFMKLLKYASLGNESEAMIFIKVLIFIALVILFSVRGAFFVDAVEDSSVAVRFVLSGLYAVMSAGLIISTILVFVSGASFISGSMSGDSTNLWELYNQSQFIRSIVANSHFWFSVPALSFLVHSLYTKKD